MNRPEQGNGDSGVLGSLVILIVLAALAQVLLGINVVGYFGTAVDAVAGLMQRASEAMG